MSKKIVKFLEDDEPLGVVPMANHDWNLSSNNKKQYPTSILKKRRWQVQEMCHPHAAAMYDYLSTRSGNRNWRYICRVNLISVDRWGFQVEQDYKFVPDRHDSEHEISKQLFELRMGKIHFCFPWFALVRTEGLVMARFVLGEQMIFVYDIHKEKIILDLRG